MKIRFLFFLSALFVGACCLTSCEEGATDENTDELASIYWNKSAAFQMQLKGKVKTLYLEDSTAIVNFNESGNLISDVSFEEVTHYNYSNGRLTSIINRSIWDDQSYMDTTTFTYGASGKYVPMDQEVLGGLYRNLASFHDRIRSTSFVQSGDSMLMILSHEGHYTAMNRTPMAMQDTAVLKYNGGVFPVSLRRGIRMTSMTYATDGRFLTVDDVYNYGEGQLYSYLTTYMSDSEYLLPISRVDKENGQTTSTTTYTYNENGDQLTYVNSDYEVEYRDYQYDSNGNWISRKHRSRYTYVENPTWSDDLIQTRSFTYWN